MARRQARDDRRSHPAGAEDIRERWRRAAQAAELRRDRVRLCFGIDGVAWDEEKVLERYELLYEAGLVQEAARDGGRRVPAIPALGAA